jgi:phosphoadenosine phosphosulfate reductase
VTASPADLRREDAVSRLRKKRLPTIPRDAEAFGAQTVLRIALETLGASRLVLSTSLGPESIVILDLVSDMETRPRVVTVDTGRLPEQTHSLLERVRARFAIEIDVLTPDEADVDAMVRERGRDLFYRSVDDRVRCCDVRKVEPLSKALRNADGWITGLRREQSTTRWKTPKLSLDVEHGLIWKVNPLADWSSERVWHYIRTRDLPYNTLHDMGYPSVGCAPCSRAVPAGADERSGRWWWETPESRECGLHVQGAQLAAIGRSHARDMEPAG